MALCSATHKNGITMGRESIKVKFHSVPLTISSVHLYYFLTQHTEFLLQKAGASENRDVGKSCRPELRSADCLSSAFMVCRLFQRCTSFSAFFLHHIYQYGLLQRQNWVE